jgi:hypothetical protein
LEKRTVAAISAVASSFVEDLMDAPGKYGGASLSLGGAVGKEMGGPA